MRPGALWERLALEALQIAFLENAGEARPASSLRNIRHGFERDRLVDVLRQAVPGNDHPERRGGGIGLRRHYRESRHIPVG